MRQGILPGLPIKEQAYAQRRHQLLACPGRDGIHANISSHNLTVTRRSNSLATASISCCHHSPERSCHTRLHSSNRTLARQQIGVTNSSKNTEQDSHPGLRYLVVNRNTRFTLLALLQASVVARLAHQVRSYWQRRKLFW